MRRVLHRRAEREEVRERAAPHVPCLIDAEVIDHVPHGDHVDHDEGVVRLALERGDGAAERVRDVDGVVVRGRGDAVEIGEGRDELARSGGGEGGGAEANGGVGETEEEREMLFLEFDLSWYIGGRKGRNKDVQRQFLLPRHS